MTLENKVMGRQSARAAADLIVECTETLDDEARYAFWDQVRDELLERGCDLRGADQPRVASPAPVVPMSDLEKRAFEHSTVPFGKHSGRQVQDCPLTWFDWLIGQKDFKVDLRRYMARSDVQEALQRELESKVDSGRGLGTGP